MKQRISQLIARSIGVAAFGVMAKFGIEDDGTIVANIEAIAAVVVSSVADPLSYQMDQTRVIDESGWESG